MEKMQTDPQQGQISVIGKTDQKTKKFIKYTEDFNNTIKQPELIDIYRNISNYLRVYIILKDTRHLVILSTCKCTS